MQQLISIGLVLLVVGLLTLVGMACSCHNANVQINQQALPQYGRLPKYVGTQSRWDEATWGADSEK